jgi:hypothetical protein
LKEGAPRTAIMHHRASCYIEGSRPQDACWLHAEWARPLPQSRVQRGTNLASGRVNRVSNVGQSRVQRGIPACRFLALVGPASVPVIPPRPLRQELSDVPNPSPLAGEGRERGISQRQDNVEETGPAPRADMILDRSGRARHAFIEPRRKMKQSAIRRGAGLSLRGVPRNAGWQSPCVW